MIKFFLEWELFDGERKLGCGVKKREVVFFIIINFFLGGNGFLNLKEFVENVKQKEELWSRKEKKKKELWWFKKKVIKRTEAVMIKQKKNLRTKVGMNFLSVSTGLPNNGVRVRVHKFKTKKGKEELQIKLM